MNAAERTMRCREMKLVEGNRIYERNISRDSIQGSSVNLIDQKYK